MQRANSDTLWVPECPVCSTTFLFVCILTKDEDGSCKAQADYAADLVVLKDTATIVRTYANVDAGDTSGPICYVPGALLPAAKAAGVKVILGIWYDNPKADNH